MAGDPISNHAAFIWSVADLLRGDYKQSEYGKVILPLTVLRRLDCVLDPVKPAMLDEYRRVEGKVQNFGPILQRLSGVDHLWNISDLDFRKLLDDPDNVAPNLRAEDLEIDHDRNHSRAGARSRTIGRSPHPSVNRSHLDDLTAYG